MASLAREFCTCRRSQALSSAVFLKGSSTPVTPLFPALQRRPEGRSLGCCSQDVPSVSAGRPTTCSGLHLPYRCAVGRSPSACRAFGCAVCNLSQSRSPSVALRARLLPSVTLPLYPAARSPERRTRDPAIPVNRAAKPAAGPDPPSCPSHTRPRRLPRQHATQGL